ncbi:MAG: hypothetical protein WCL18_08130 [bacterium]
MIINEKSTIDEGFFGFFLDLEAKKKRPAGEAINNNKKISITKYPSETYFFCH